MAEPPVKSRARFQFELRHLLYATVLLAASLGLCGGWGIALALFVLLFWWDVFSKLRQSVAQAAQARADADEGEPPTSQSDSPDRSAFTLTELLVVIAIIAILIVLLLPAVFRMPSWFGCRINLNNVSRALEQYHQTNGSFPPAYLLDDTGSPAHSWRVLILPELGRQDLYDQYRFDEPWNGPHNRKLLKQTPREYECRQRESVFGRHRPLEPGMTTYLAVTGKDAAWPGAAPRTLAELADSPYWTALVVEAEFQPVPWTKPEDFSIKQSACLVDPPDSVEDGPWLRGFLWSTFRGRQAILADGDVRFLPPCKAAIMEELLTVTDGKPDKDATYLDAEPPDNWTRIHYTNIARLAFFFVAAAWPILWIRPTIRRHRETLAAGCLEQ